MDEGNYTFDNLKSKYNNFLNPAVEIEVDGKPLGEDYLVLECELAFAIENDEIGTALFKVRHKESGFKDIEKLSQLSSFPLMQEVKIKAGYEENRAQVFSGLIYERELNMESPFNSVISVLCLDHKVLMRHRLSFEGYDEISSFSALIGKVTGEYGFETSIDSTDDFEKPIPMARYGDSDFDYIKKIADEIGFEFFVMNGKMYFRKPMSLGGTIISLGKESILRLIYRTSLAGVYAGVEMGFYNQDKNERGSVSCMSVSQKVGSGKTGAEIMSEKDGKAIRNAHGFVSGRLSQNPENAVQAIMDQSGMRLANLNLTTFGMPELIPGRLIEIEHVNGEIDNTYYIKSVRHVIKAESFTTELACCSNTINQ